MNAGGCGGYSPPDWARKGDRHPVTMVSWDDAREYTAWLSEETGAPVGSFRANAFGLYDVLGNVREWTEDCWNANYSGAPTDGSAWRMGDCSHRVLRGGSWLSGPWFLRSALRLGISAGVRGSLNGFRVARTINRFLDL